MKYYLDTEFDGFGDELISLALVRETGEHLYMVDPNAEVKDEWVRENVIPILFDTPNIHYWSTPKTMGWSERISEFLYADGNYPQIICDWPSDIIYLCELLMTGPGISVPMFQQTHFTVLRHIDVYPTELKGAVQHNAWWDALALKHFCETMGAQ